MKIKTTRIVSLAVLSAVALASSLQAQTRPLTEPTISTPMFQPAPAPAPTETTPDAADLDMQGFRILNLAAPQTATDAVNLGHVQGMIAAVPGDNLGNAIANRNLQMGTFNITTTSGGLQLGTGSITFGTSGALQMNGRTIQMSNGDITSAREVFANVYFHTSDERMKADIESLNPEMMRDSILRLRPVAYRWAEGDSEDRVMGLIAQEVQTVFPSAVSTRDDGMLAVDYSQLISPMIATISSLQGQVDAMTMERDVLMQTIRDMDARIGAMEASAAE